MDWAAAGERGFVDSVAMSETPAVGARTSVVRLLLLTAAVAGLFAMHGLGDHGAAHSGTAAVAMSGEQMGHGSPGPVEEHAPAAQATHDDAPAVTRFVARADAGSSVMGLCMAVVAGVLFALSGLRAWGRLRAMVAPGSHACTRFAATARERDPPRLVQLSICRC